MLRSYRTLLEVLGLYVDHHGWVYPLQRRGDRAKLEAAGVDFLLPRVLRSLSLLELRDDRCVLAAECFAVLRMA